MDQNKDARWSPQSRPEWVTVLNQVGENFGIEGPRAVIALGEESLIDAACAATGLSDFGDEDWREPFALLLRDMEEANLNLTGRLLARIDVLQSLVARLRLTETERKHPEILEQRIESPIFITGLGRTGTTILLELLGQHPGLRAIKGWEFRYPSPLSERPSEADPRIAMTTADVELWSQVVPGFDAIHEIAVTEPEADSVGMRHAFASTMWSATQKSPRYDAWLAKDRLQHALRFHRRLLKHMQWQTPGRFILKFPSYLGNLPSLFAEFPDARVIITHRDPIKVMSSSADMLATLRWQRSDVVNYQEIASAIVNGFPLLLDMVSDQRDGGVIPNSQIIDVRYADLMSDTRGTLGSLCHELGVDLTPAARQRMQTYLDAKPKGRHGNRNYRFENLGVEYDKMASKFDKYMNRYDVPRER